MAETSTTVSGAPTASAAAPRGLAALLRDGWQVPLLVVAMVGLASAFWYARSNRAPNQWDETLAQATGQIDAREFAVAAQILEEVIAPHLASAPDGFAGRFEAARVDLAAEQLKSADGASADAYGQVAKRYEALMKEFAERGSELSDAQMARYGAMLLGAGRESDAVAAAANAGDGERARRLASRLGRRSLEQAYGDAQADPRKVDAFFDAFEEFRAAPQLSAEDRAWSAGLAGRMRLATGHAAAAIERLLVELPRADGAASRGDTVSAAQFAELWYLLGEAFRREGVLGDAEHTLLQARLFVTPAAPLAGEIDLALGLTKLATGQAEEAHGILDRAVLTEHPAEIKSALILARARASAALSRVEDSLRDFDEMLALAEKSRLSAGLAGDAQRALNELARSALGAEDFETAIAYSERAAALDGTGSEGAFALATLAESAARHARAMRAAEVESVGSLSAIEPGARARINRVFRRAGEAYAGYLDTESAKELSNIERAELHFGAADSFDCAGESAQALVHFERSLALLPEGDSRRTERLLRIGDIRAAAREFDKAREAYEGVYRITQNDPRVAMPLCRVLVDSGDTTRAIAELGRILDGHAGLRPDSEQYREALDLSARLSFERGDFTASAERLSELIERDPAAGPMGERQFRLAQSLQAIARQAAEESRGDGLTGSRRGQLERIAAERTRDAQQSYQRAIEVLESQGRALDGLGRDMLRNAYLQRAHCAFDRGDHKEAIDFYEAVDRKYADAAASVLALVQIVNAAEALGDRARAEAAHTRALRRIESLPDDALVGDGGVLGRDDWRKWLRSHPPGARRVADAEGAGTEEGRP